MTLKVFYDQRQNVESNNSISPSAGKPKLVVEEWTRKGYKFELGEVKQVPRHLFYMAHNQRFVDLVLDCVIDNGFKNRSKDVAAALPWTTGSMCSAAFHSFLTKENSCSPTSGFHHAEWESSMGFCTFNGLMVAAMRLREELQAKQVGIVDIDHHYGNGTDDIIERRRIDYVQHYTFGADNSNYTWKGGPQAVEWLQKLPDILKQFKNCDVIIYQAGGDPHVNDPYGGALTDEQLRERDKIVFATFKEMNIPVAWNLAGGYQTPIQKVLDIHNATMEECLKSVNPT